MPAATQARISIPELNAISREEFTSRFAGVLEHSPHFAERVAEGRPYADLKSLSESFHRAITAASADEQLALLRAHPDLANRLNGLTQSSTQEQMSAGLDSLTAGELEEFRSLNAAYRNRFGFPFIICARLNSKEAILAAFRARLSHTREMELGTALGEVGKIADLRLQDLVEC